MHRRSLSLSIFEVVYLRITLFLCFCRFTILVVALWVLTAFKALASHARRCFMNIQFISVLCFVFIWTSNTPRRTFASVRHHVRRLQAGHIIVACCIGNTPLEPGTLISYTLSRMWFVAIHQCSPLSIPKLLSKLVEVTGAYADGAITSIFSCSNSRILGCRIIDSKDSFCFLRMLCADRFSPVELQNAARIGVHVVGLSRFKTTSHLRQDRKRWVRPRQCALSRFLFVPHFPTLLCPILLVLVISPTPSL